VWSRAEVKVVDAHTSWVVWAGRDPGARRERAVRQDPRDASRGGESPIDAHLRCLVRVNRAQPQMMLAGAVDERLEPGFQISHAGESRTDI
jgi:hypothetical protein